MMRKPNFDKEFPFSHYVDDEKQIVYVHVHSFAGSMGAHVKGKQFWPGYEVMNVSEDKLNELLKNA